MGISAAAGCDETQIKYKAHSQGCSRRRGNMPWGTVPNRRLGRGSPRCFGGRRSRCRGIGLKDWRIWTDCFCLCSTCLLLECDLRDPAWQPLSLAPDAWRDAAVPTQSVSSDELKGPWGSSPVSKDPLQSAVACLRSRCDWELRCRRTNCSSLSSFLPRQSVCWQTLFY